MSDENENQKKNDKNVQVAVVVQVNGGDDRKNEIETEIKTALSKVFGEKED